MKNTPIQFSETGVVKPLMQHYLNKNSDIKPFINRFASLQSFENQIKDKQKQIIDRQGLSTALIAQNEGLIVSELTAKNLKSLRNSNTFTVTTGHQPCLFTGPLYFVIKILNTIKLADTLNKTYPDSHFVPVYWMGAEDHDFEEINHFRLYNKLLKWESNEQGAVGRFSTEGLSEVYDKLTDILSDNPNANYLKSLFEKAYLSQHNYAMATRVLVNELFGKRGIVIIDGDDPYFKKSFESIAARELKDKITFKAVSETNIGISGLGKAQVKPREINLFYLDKDSRRRIIFEEDHFILDGLNERYSLNEMLDLLKLYPERFSPNVLLRPVYQEKILPNLAYIGGMGEMAYWLQLKSLFEKFEMVLPLLLVRNSFLFLNANQAKKLDKLGLKTKDLFIDEQDLIKKIVHSNDGAVSFDKEHTQISKVLDELRQKAMVIDPSLNQVFSGEKQRILKSLYNLEKRAYKSLKQKNEIRINQAISIKERLFPGGGLQERIDNFAGFYEQEGASFFDHIYEAIDPVETRLNVLL